MICAGISGNNDEISLGMNYCLPIVTELITLPGFHNCDYIAGWYNHNGNLTDFGCGALLAVRSAIL